MESFNEARKRFLQFLKDNGFPPQELWVDWGDVIVDGGMLHVYKLEGADRESTVEKRFAEAARRRAGLAFEAVCTAGGFTCCFVYLPLSEDEAERLMVPKTGVKLSVPSEPREAQVVTDSIEWSTLKIRGKDYLKSIHR